MKTNLFKKVFAFIIAMSMVSIPAISHAGISATGNELFNLSFNRDYGTGTDAGDASFTDGVYSLAELNAGVYVENGEVKTATNPTVQGYTSIEPTFALAEESPSTVGKISMTEDFTGTAGFKIPVDTITTGTFVVGSQIHAYGAGGLGRVVLGLSGKSVISFKGGGNTIYPCWLTESDATSSNVFELTLTRTDEESDWTATLKHGWNYLNNTVTGTIAAADLPSITSIGGTAWRGAQNPGTATNLGYRYIKATHYPVEYVTPSCDIQTVRTANPSINVSFSGKVQDTTISNITFTNPAGENMIKSSSLSEDGLTATLSLNNLLDGQLYTLDVPSTVKDESGVGVTPLTKQIKATVKDNVLFDIDFSKDYSEDKNGVYTIADLAKVYDCVDTTNTWAARTGFTVDATNGYATLTNTSTGTTSCGFKLLTGNVESGELKVDMKLWLVTNNSAARCICINGTNFIQAAANGQQYYFAGDASTEFIKISGKPFQMGLKIYRENTDSNWTVDIYNNETSELLATNTLSKADYTSIDSIGFSDGWLPVAGASQSANAYLYSMKAELVDTNALYNIDFSEIDDGTYTTAQLNEALGANIMTEGGNPISYVVENGVGKVYGTKGGAQVTATTNFDAIEKGCVAFDVSFDHEASGIANRQRQVFNLKSSLGKVTYLMTDSPYGGNQPFYAAADHFNDTKKLEFINGDNGYYVGDDENITHNIRVVVMREDTASDWRVRMYDLDASSSVPVLTTTLKATDYPAISNTFMSYWVGGSEAYDKMYIPLRKYTANYISMEEMSAVETMKIEDSAGAIITNLADETVVADGVVNCVVDVNRTGGVLYAGIYDGDRLVDVQMVKTTTMGEYTLPFSVENPTASKSMKLFYWDLNSSPITSTMDPLLRK